ncbi:uncharacterized protein LTR77_009765 [Saxophila tyrrhenica]|uniref:2,6-dihydroxypyridine 3-monooxygenase substrate binding domain-containing protein n=1 Tax=Saxophila tyrrhenica TaxID=1690608 RepID=A0AAV9NXC7_9PEZI|nr:hypothetical protein LTR77_009765 [Saxophila tyrrhenica]
MTSTHGNGEDRPQPPQSTSSFADGVKPLNIFIVGGSLAGLFCGILLKRQGHNVHILESASSSAREGQAAGIGLAADIKRFFDQHDRLKHIPLGTPVNEIQILDADLKPATIINVPYEMTTWDAAYYRLRANFDGLVSPYCPDPPPTEPGEGEATYATNIKVLSVQPSTTASTTLTLSATDLSTSKPVTYTATHVIAADGANSTLRSSLYPNLQRHEPGYLIWRGVVPCASLTPSLVARIADKALLYPMNKSYVMLYTIPGAHGSLAPQKRAVNFAWYDYPPPSVPVSSILTDTAGHTHRTTLPKGAMRPEIWSAQLARAREMFHPDLLEIPEKLKEPFVSVIASLMSPAATAYEGRMFFVGDALVLLQPNSGKGTNHAAVVKWPLRDVSPAKAFGLV